jgi:hypothetical protein
MDRDQWSASRFGPLNPEERGPGTIGGGGGIGFPVVTAKRQIPAPTGNGTLVINPLHSFNAFICCVVSAGLTGQCDWEEK